MHSYSPPWYRTIYWYPAIYVNSSPFFGLPEKGARGMSTCSVTREEYNENIPEDIQDKC